MKLWMVFGLSFFATSIALTASVQQNTDTKPEFSGIYPHLAYVNREGECGTGAVVPWANRLWVITYAPHAPKGSSDKLYEITPGLQQIIRPESVGGTPANRMIHRESNQLFIGPYVIDAQGKVRVIPHSVMPGRLTANARHLTNPAEKIYFTTMEEGVYEVDVKSLAVKTLFTDGNMTKKMDGSLLPGYHGKGSYSGQGVLVYANNGENSAQAMKNPFVPSGVLAEWDGETWKVIRRLQFTEVTGPDGIMGASKPETQPVWSVGWDAKSVILMLRDKGGWHEFRLPKASHSYDGAHGWNTEWPRIRNVGTAEKPDYLMTMHGMFWRFPGDFSLSNTAGITPVTSYLKVIGDFCRWNDRLVFGCDDTAKSEFLNTRKAKGHLAGPGQSNSNLWFIEPAALQKNAFGPITAKGAVWLREAVAADSVSAPFLAGSRWNFQQLCLVNEDPSDVTLTIEYLDAKLTVLPAMSRKVNVPGGSSLFESAGVSGGEWIRLRAHHSAAKFSAVFACVSPRSSFECDPMFNGLAKVSTPVIRGGLLHSMGDPGLHLQMTATEIRDGVSRPTGYYQLDSAMSLVRVDSPAAMNWVFKNVAIPRNVIVCDSASVVYSDENGKRYRLPKGDARYTDLINRGLSRVVREIATERDLLSCHGTFYELPARNAGGVARIRPVTSHNFAAVDFCSWRGLLLISGLDPAAPVQKHLIKSADGHAMLWAGTVDDLWKMGKPYGQGAFWPEKNVRANEPSDPYLFNGYDKKSLSLTQTSHKQVMVKLELDLTGDGFWVPYKTVKVKSGEMEQLDLSDAVSGYWIRATADRDCVLTTVLDYR